MIFSFWHKRKGKDGFLNIYWLIIYLFICLQVCTLSSCGPFLIGLRMVDRTAPEIVVCDYFRELEDGQMKPDHPGRSRLCFKPSEVPLHVLPSLNPPVHLRVERCEAVARCSLEWWQPKELTLNSLMESCRKRKREEQENGPSESVVQHLLVGTFHTNLYHSLRNDWPTTPIATSRSNSIFSLKLLSLVSQSFVWHYADIYQAYETDKKEQIVYPHPLETTKVALNNCNFKKFPQGNFSSFLFSRNWNLPIELADTLPRKSRWVTKPVRHHIDLRYVWRLLLRTIILALIWVVQVQQAVRHS